MKKVEILRHRLNNKESIIMDGATGTELQHRGVKTTLPLWSASAIFTHPETLKRIHIEYIQSGADIIITNTFRTTARTFGKSQLKHIAREAVLKACELARQAIRESGVSRDIFIAGSVAPLEDCYSPDLTPPVEDLEKEHYEYIRDLQDGGADFILIETMITIRETTAALEAAKKLSMPVAVSFCCTPDGQLLGGEDLSEAIKQIETYKPLFVGVNCIDAKTVPQLIEKIKSVTSTPISAYAQGDGEPHDDQGWIFTGTKGAVWYTQQTAKWKALGAQVIGGCCGTTPEYIQLITAARHS